MTTLNSPQTPRSTTASSPAPGPAPVRSGRGIAWLVSGALVLFMAIATLITGAVVSVADNSWRQDGYLTSDQIALTTQSHAISTERLDLEDIAPLWPDIESLLGDVRIQATGPAGSAIFVGIAPADRAAAYLDGVGHATLTELADPATTYAEHPGGAPAARPADQDFWVAQSSGTGTQAVQWPLDDGAWAVVVMNADGSAGVDARVDLGATAPVQEWAGRVLLIGGAVLALFGIALILLGVYRRRSAAYLTR